ncbi:MAG: hypothetical protein IJP17_08200 [Clostridia bacterium]|nr:hypothetical protein [Clostridia bacterium]
MFYDSYNPRENYETEDLYDVLDRSDEAREYFMSLPGQVREKLECRIDEINSLEELRNHADIIMNRD